MRKLINFMNCTVATHTHRQRRLGGVTVARNSVDYHYIDCGGSKTGIEAAMANLRFFDANTNSLVVKDISVGTYSREVVMNIHRKLTLRNNYQVPCEVSVYKCWPKDATNITSRGAYINGMTDQMVSFDSTSPLLYPSDSREMKNLWQVKLAKSCVLQPGSFFSLSDKQKDFCYQFSTNDSHALEYDRNQGGFNWLIRIAGVLGHAVTIPDPTYGTVRAGLDWMCNTTFHMKYDAGKDLEDYSVNNLSNLVVTGLVSQKPVVDNQSYDDN